MNNVYYLANIYICILDSEEHAEGKLSLLSIIKITKTILNDHVIIFLDRWKKKSLKIASSPSGKKSNHFFVYHYIMIYL